jgi:hypothetical protein
MLRTLLLLNIALLATSQGGCSVCHNAHRTVIEEPSRFSWKHDRARSRELYSRWADQEWRARGRAEASCDSPTYRAGFQEGFVEYVFAGGNGEPPAVPPREFWNAELRNERGQSLADLWFAGYRHGASVARDGGYRDMVVVRSSLWTSEADDVALHAALPAAPLEYYDETSDPHPAEAELIPPSATYEYLPEEPGSEEPDPAPAEQADEAVPFHEGAPPGNPFEDDPAQEELPRGSAWNAPPASQMGEYRQATAGGTWQRAGTSRQSMPQPKPRLDSATYQASAVTDDLRTVNPFLQ